MHDLAGAVSDVVSAAFCGFLLMRSPPIWTRPKIACFMVVSAIATWLLIQTISPMSVLVEIAEPEVQRINYAARVLLVGTSVIVMMIWIWRYFRNLTNDHL